MEGGARRYVVVLRWHGDLAADSFLSGGAMAPPALYSDLGADYRPVFRSHAPSSPSWRTRVESFMEETKLTKDIFSG